MEKCGLNACCSCRGTSGAILRKRQKNPSGFCINLLTCSRFVSFQEKLCPVGLFSNMLIVSGE